MTVTLLTKRVLVASGGDQLVAVLDAEHNRAPMMARLPLPPVMQAGQISHLDAWRQVRAELRQVSGSPAVVAAYAHFMTMVEDQANQYTFPLMQQAAQAVLHRMQAPAAAAAPIANNLVSQAHANKTLLVLEDSKLLARTRPKRAADLIRIRAKVLSISNTVFRKTGLTLPAWIYNYRNGALTKLESFI